MYLAVGDQFSVETLQVLAMSWGVCAKRRFSRADRNGNIKAAIGLENAARAIAGLDDDEEEDTEEIKPRSHAQKNIALESIPEDFIAAESEVKSRYTTHHEIRGGQDDTWDMVAKGRVFTDAYDKERMLLSDSQIRQIRKSDRHWEIVNVSAGGYCLRRNSDTASRAQIGELIALLEKEPDDTDAWRIGVIRWMQFTRQSGLEIGVQVLSPKVMSAKAQRKNRPNEEPFDCLMLPGIKPLNLPASVLLPAHAFRPKDNLKIRVTDQENETEIRLQAVKEHTGSFTQFEFEFKEALEKKAQEAKMKSSAKNKDNFDEIWSSL